MRRQRSITAGDIINNSESRVYYKPEEDKAKDNPEGIDFNQENADKFFVEPQSSITYPIDGVATSKCKDMVYKVPDGAGVIVFPKGEIRMVCIPSNEKYFAACTVLEGLPDIITDIGYKYKWMKLYDFKSIDRPAWQPLFEKAKEIGTQYCDPTPSRHEHNPFEPDKTKTPIDDERQRWIDGRQKRLDTYKKIWEMKQKRQEEQEQRDKEHKERLEKEQKERIEWHKNVCKSDKSSKGAGYIPISVMKRI